MSRFSNLNKGFIALITVLIITAISLIVASTMIFKSLNRADIGVSEIKSAQAWAAANACVEDVLGQLGAGVATTTWSNYALSASITDLATSTLCFTMPMLPVNATGTTETYHLIRSTGTVGDYSRRLEVTVATNTPKIVISSWQEVSSF